MQGNTSSPRGVGDRVPGQTARVASAAVSCVFSCLPASSLRLHVSSAATPLLRVSVTCERRDTRCNHAECRAELESGFNLCQMTADRGAGAPDASAAAHAVGQVLRRNFCLPTPSAVHPKGRMYHRRHIASSKSNFTPKKLEGQCEKQGR